MWNEIPVKWNPRFINNGMPILTISLPNRRTTPQYGWFLMVGRIWTSLILTNLVIWSLVWFLQNSQFFGDFQPRDFYKKNSYKKETVYCKIFKNTYVEEHLRTAASSSSWNSGMIFIRLTSNVISYKLYVDIMWFIFHKSKIGQRLRYENVLLAVREKFFINYG